MEYEVKIKQISNGYVVEFWASATPLGEDQRPIHVEQYDEAVKLAYDWLRERKAGE